MTSNRYLIGTMKLALALAVGLGAGLAYQKYGRSPSDELGAPLPNQPFAAAAAARLDAVVLVGGARHNAADGRIALPSGTRFTLQLSATRDGVVEVQAINPAGQASAAPLWTGTLKSGSPLEMPAMRLDGQKGLETLRIVLRSQGQVLTQRDVQIWHM